MANPPATPPIVLVRAGRDEPHTAFLIAWERGESGGPWSAWVMWVRERDGKPYRHTVLVGADMVQPVEHASAYRHVPRRIRSEDGVIRPCAPS
jgi:hypothetical protein